MALQKDEFHIILPSNSSMLHFPDNTTTHFITQLSQPLKLTGERGVSLEEISIPINFLNSPVKHATVLFTLIHDVDLLDFFKVNVTDVYNLENAENHATRLPPGVYQKLDHLLVELNKLVIMSEHIKWELNPGGYMDATIVCEDSCNGAHLVQLSPYLQQILGFPVDNKPELLPLLKSTRPENIYASVPCSLFVYTDICENYVRGDVQTPLLRIVPLDMHNYTYGSMRIKSFSTMRYIPLLKPDIRTIEIDIRDEFGQAIPFEHGTLTVTLHFKKLR